VFHSSTELLIDYWRTRRGDARLPARADIELAGFASIAARVFLAERDAAGDVRFRIAGETLVELQGRPLKGESLLRLWRPSCRGRLASLLRATLVAARPLVVIAEAEADDGAPATLEVLFTPLLDPEGGVTLLFGLCQPLTRGPLRRIGELRLVRVEDVPGFVAGPHLRLAAIDGRQIA
jgi:hypothetical protein